MGGWHGSGIDRIWLALVPGGFIGFLLVQWMRRMPSTIEISLHGIESDEVVQRIESALAVEGVEVPRTHRQRTHGVIRGACATAARDGAVTRRLVGLRAPAFQFLLAVLLGAWLQQR